MGATPKGRRQQHDRVQQLVLVGRVKHRRKVRVLGMESVRAVRSEGDGAAAAQAGNREVQLDGGGERREHE